MTTERSEQEEFEAGHPRSVRGGMGFQSRVPSAPEVVAALREGVERVLVPAVSQLGKRLRWGVLVLRGDDDLDRPGVGYSPGLDWAAVEAAGDVPGRAPASSIAVFAELTDPAPWPPDMRWTPVRTSALFLSRAGAPLTVELAVQHWAVGGRTAHVAGELRDWAPDAAATLGADTGYVTLDFGSVGSGVGALEHLTGVLSGRRRFTDRLWDYGWWVLLNPAHLARMGGMRRATPLPHLL